MIERSRIRVLVVDDESAIRHSLAAFLEDFDFQVFVAASAEEALEMLAAGSFHVGVIDLRLPGMSGDVLIPLAYEIDPCMRFMIHTGSSGFNMTGELARTGLRPEHIFLKPLPDMSVLVEALETLVGEEAGNHE